MKDTYKSRVYTDRPAYADFDAPAKFQALQSIIAKRIREHPKAICSYSGGSDSDILLDLIERTRATIPMLPPVKYVFFNTGLEMQAIKDHVKETAKKYGVEIETVCPEKSIVQASREYGIPFLSKAMSDGLGYWQKKNVPLSIADEFALAKDKTTKRQELNERYPKCVQVINFLCSCNSVGEPQRSQISINAYKFLLDFIREFPPDFQISDKCCDYCKKQPAHMAQKGYDLIITGERKAEGGLRTVSHNGNATPCFTETRDGQYRFRPLYYVSNSDKVWYKERYGIKYSDAYEVYGLTRTGCCGCPISHKATEGLEKIRPYEPYVVKATYNIFGASYAYRAKYNAYKEKRRQQEKNISDKR